MNRARSVEALLAALATLAVALPLTTLFSQGTWFRPAVVLVAVVALTGIGLRRLTSSRPSSSPVRPRSWPTPRPSCTVVATSGATSSPPLRRGVPSASSCSRPSRR